MRKSIFRNLTEYKENYNQELNLFLTKFREASEKEFIQEQIKLYQICMNNTCIVKRKDGSVYTVLSILNGSEQIKSILDEFMDSHGNRFDKEKCTSLFYGFKRIKEYLP